MQKDKLAASVVVSGYIMAIARMATADPHTVSTSLKSLHNELRVKPARAGEANDPEVRGIVKPADASQIRGPVSTPIAEEGHNFGFKITHTQPQFVPGLI
jgi:plasmid stability protein